MLHKPLDFLGFSGAQTSNVLTFFDGLFKRLASEKRKLVRILDVGIGGGGLSCFLALYACQQQIEYHAFDWDIDFVNDTASFPWYKRSLRTLGVIPHRGDVLRDEQMIQLIGSLISSEGLSLVMLDNGEKLHEYNLYSAFLKPGDIVCAHDYCKNFETWERDFKDKIWNSMEISEDHASTFPSDLSLLDVDKKYDLISYCEDIANPQAYLCRMKRMED